jgi:hypothetical protein
MILVTKPKKIYNKISIVIFVIGRKMMSEGQGNKNSGYEMYVGKPERQRRFSGDPSIGGRMT